MRVGTYRLKQLSEILAMAGCMQALSTTVRWMLRKEYLVFVRDLMQPLPPLPGNDRMQWTGVRGADIPKLLAINPGLTGSEVQRRIQEGQRCLLCTLGGSPAHYRWDTDRSAYLPYLHRTVQLKVGDTLANESFTHPEFRKKGIDTIGSILALHRARQRGCTRSITFVAPWNIPSLRTSHDRTGRKLIGRVGFWTLGPKRIYFNEGAVHCNHDGIIEMSPDGR